MPKVAQTQRELQPLNPLTYRGISMLIPPVKVWGGENSPKTSSRSDPRVSHTWGGGPPPAPAIGGPLPTGSFKPDPSLCISAHNQKCVRAQLDTLRFKCPEGLCPHAINKQPTAPLLSVSAGGQEVPASPEERGLLSSPGNRQRP